MQKRIVVPSFSTKPKVQERGKLKRSEVEKEIIKRFKSEESKIKTETDTEIEMKKNSPIKPKRTELKSNTVTKSQTQGSTSRERAIERIQEKRKNVLSNRTSSNNFNKPIGTIYDNKKSDTVFIIGGGPSLKGFDFNKLTGLDTIAINKSVDYIKDPNYFITIDYTYLSKSNRPIEDITSSGTSSIFVANTSGNLVKKGEIYSDVKHNINYNRLNEFNYVIESNFIIDNTTGFSRNFTGFANGNNSGFCAIQLAILLGYKKIYLLGFDLHTNGSTHFHNSYRNTNISNNISSFRENLINALRLRSSDFNIYNCSNTSTLPSDLIEYIDFDTINVEKIETKKDLSDLLIVGYYTLNTPYEDEAKFLIDSCKKLNLNHEIKGVDNLGSWQSNTRYKAIFMLDMLKSHPDKRLLYVDCDAIINSKPDLFINYSADISVRYQDFSWRKNECLSGTIYMENNLKTRRLCELWANANVAEGPRANTFEQWNLGRIIDKMVRDEGLVFKNLPAEYTFIFDSMKKIYPNAKPVIEHFQASRRFKNKV